LVKQPNHAFFCGFAPRENPKIAIMCVVENSGRFGGTYAAPIVGLMIEKYLNDSIAGKARKERMEQLSKLNLIPPRIYKEMQRRDSLSHAKDSAYLIAKGYIKLLKDTMGMDVSDEEDALDQIKKVKEDQKAAPVKKDSNSNPVKINPSAILPQEKKKPQKDSLKN
jgi:penicillin-binding protein 2